MKILKYLGAILLLLTFTVACKENPKTKEEKTVKEIKEVALKRVALQIEGMTCQIGCAKTIESKLSKTDGVQKSVVSFEDKIGEFVYDANQITKEEIAEKITAIAGGKTYSVSQIKELNL